MARELRVSFPVAGATLYAVIRRRVDAAVWNGSRFENWSDANIATYDVPLTDRGGDLYDGNFPSSIHKGDYHIFFYEQAGGAPDITDSLLKNIVRRWDGGALSELWPG